MLYTKKQREPVQHTEMTVEEIVGIVRRQRLIKETEELMLKRYCHIICEHLAWNPTRHGTDYRCTKYNILLATDYDGVITPRVCIDDRIPHGQVHSRR